MSALATPAVYRPKVVLDKASYARWYVQKRIADQLPKEAHLKFLDLIIAVKHLRSLYQEYADMLSEVEIDPAAFEDFLTAQAKLGLSNNTKAIIQQLIVNEAKSYNADLTKTLKFLADAMCRVDETDTAFTQLCDARIFSY